MLTAKDLKKITEYQVEVFKDVFTTKTELNVVEQKIDRILTVVDGLAKNDKKNHQEITVVGARVSNVETWVEKAGPKIGLKYER